MNILPVYGQSSAGTLTAQSFLPFVRTPEDANFPVPRCGQVAMECFYCAPERVSIIATGDLSHVPVEVGHGFTGNAYDALSSSA
jgi:hypothetical protein